MRCLHTSIHAWRIGSYVLCSVNDIYFDFSSVVLAVDAGHQMKKKSSSLHVLNHYRWFDFRRFSSLGMENFIKGNTVLLKQRRKFTSVCDKEGNRVALAEFATTLPEERQLTRNKGNGLWMNQVCLRIQLRSSSGF
jgi:cytochrome c oxidase subunit 3